MEITHLAHSNTVGGAANYLRRVIDSLDLVGIENKLLASALKPNNIDTHFFRSNTGNRKINYLIAKLCQTLDRNFRILEKTSRYTYKSPNFIGAVHAKKLNQSKADLIHLHWVNGGLISIRQIGKINKPIVWTMLDMWPFLGAEHYLSESESSRFVDGYLKVNRPIGDRGLDLSKMAWDLKKVYYKKFYLISPSTWLANKSRKSFLFKNMNLEIIPPPIDLNIFSPIPKKLARLKLKLDPNKFMVGYAGGISGRKGWEIVQKIYNNSKQWQDWHYLFAGETNEIYSKFIDNSDRSTFVGKLFTSNELVSFYSSLDVLLVPSTEEAYGLVAQEAQACGTPVIVFEDTGPADIVEDHKTGYVVEKNSTEAIINSLESLYSKDNSDKTKMFIESRSRANKLWNFEVIGNMHLQYYNKILSDK
jgi:glycosyltransferase involved in cell wall biosynthesis